MEDYKKCNGPDGELWLVQPDSGLELELRAYCKDAQMAEEAITDATSNLWKNSAKSSKCFHSAAHLANAILKAAKRQIIDYGRRKGTRRRLIENYVAAGKASSSAQEVKVTNPLINKMLAVVKSLPVADRRIVEGHFFENKTDLEIANELGLVSSSSQGRCLQILRRRKRILLGLRAQLAIYCA